ncbi:hypothetical protein BDW02DRAFT_486452 [Decorospora gaudefroyi]|uniref:Uncharacterized protein n=1 Tax=Decorospora gaudefroyi TaxID=184978 RepID=A0A6A5KXA6_9PLEO|nr:hypothetical protein BDW02DRAFT_486452 [Decorospora gaudefroyi]
MSDAFERLRWSIFEDVSSIRVVDNLQSPTPNLSPFVGHAIATESASQVPLTKIAFASDDLMQYLDHPPEALMVSRADGGIVTVADVVEQLSAYFLDHKEEILMAMESLLEAITTPEISPNTRVFFDGFFGSIEPSGHPLPVCLWIEGQDGQSAEEHWAERARWNKRCDERHNDNTT